MSSTWGLQRTALCELRSICLSVCLCACACGPSYCVHVHGCKSQETTLGVSPNHLIWDRSCAPVPDPEGLIFLTADARLAGPQALR